MATDGLGRCSAPGCTVVLNRDRVSYCSQHWKQLRRRYRSWHWQLERIARELWGLTPSQLRMFEVEEARRDLARRGAPELLGTPLTRLAGRLPAGSPRPAQGTRDPRE
jgi:hypothetical protein